MPFNCILYMDKYSLLCLMRTFLFFCFVSFFKILILFSTYFSYWFIIWCHQKTIIRTLSLAENCYLSGVYLFVECFLSALGKHSLFRVPHSVINRPLPSALSSLQTNWIWQCLSYSVSKHDIMGLSTLWHAFCFEQVWSAVTCFFLLYTRFLMSF